MIGVHDARAKDRCFSTRIGSSTTPRAFFGVTEEAEASRGRLELGQGDPDPAGQRLQVTAVQNPLTSFADDVAATNRALAQQAVAAVIMDAAVKAPVGNTAASH